ncbi:MAG: sensor histidine kinase, partial [Bacillota bacterium]|nr:sensor histidine kinase [Bacillota bacterium]
AYLSDISLNPWWLWLLPFLTAILCIIGGAVAAAVVSFLSSRYSIPGTTAITVAFIVAAIVNTLIVLVIASLYGGIVVHPRIFLGTIPGLGLGAAYAVYRYNVDTLNERMQFFQTLTDKNKQLQDASRRLAIIEERNRMGRELHDSVSQGLHGLVFSIHSLRNTLEAPSEKVLHILTHMEATASSTLDELTTMIEELKPSLLAEQGLEEALRTIGELFSQQYKVPLHLSYDAVQPMSTELEVAVYRVTQEALANIGRHASAQHAHLKLNATKGKVLLSISDDGTGLDPHSPHAGNGLANMRQRVEELGGTFKASSKPGLGSTISADFPSKG